MGLSTAVSFLDRAGLFGETGAGGRSRMLLQGYTGRVSRAGGRNACPVTPTRHWERSVSWHLHCAALPGTDFMKS
jgi:hypothetical protein